MDKLQTIFNKAAGLLAKVGGILKGEPLRAIVYGSAVIVFLVTNALGRFPDLTFDEAVTIATTASLTLIAAVETARRYVTPVTD